MDMDELKIEYVSIDSLTPYENNARKHEDFDVNFIKNSIKEFGMCDPIGVWGKNNIIVEGHGRLMALKELGYKEVPIIRLDHLNDEQRRAYTLAHNRTAEFSTWDSDKLFDELATIELDMNSLGFGAWLEDDAIDQCMDEPELREHKSGEKEIECPVCGHKILI